MNLKTLRKIVILCTVSFVMGAIAFDIEVDSFAIKAGISVAIGSFIGWLAGYMFYKDDIIEDKLY
jgi:NhaP-type Na+/H+ or K+/H+ antiporter